jgi:hypothetical protein
MRYIAARGDVDYHFFYQLDNPRGGIAVLVTVKNISYTQNYQG